MTAMQDMGVTALLELPPAGTLTGLAKRGLKGVETLALKTPDQLDAAAAFIAAHSARASHASYASHASHASHAARPATKEAQ
jgi:[acyl-carrier-protein] S-malonyltransferase